MSYNEWDFTKPILKPFREEFGDNCYFDRDLKTISVRSFLKILKRSITYLAGEYERNQSDVSRLALHIGIKSLWQFKDKIDQIKECRQKVHRSGNIEFLTLFENGSFNLDSSDLIKFSGSFPEKDLLQCAGLASAVGLDKSVVYQLSMVAAFLRADELTQKENNFYFNLLCNFREWLNNRTGNALKIAEIADGTPQSQIEGPFMKWTDVLKNSE
jgi:hypothetical protein